MANISMIFLQWCICIPSVTSLLIPTDQHLLFKALPEHTIVLYIIVYNYAIRKIGRSLPI